MPGMVVGGWSKPLNINSKDVYAYIVILPLNIIATSAFNSDVVLRF